MKYKNLLVISIIILILFTIGIIIFLYTDKQTSNKENEEYNQIGDAKVEKKDDEMKNIKEEEDILNVQEGGEEYQRDHLNSFDFEIINLDKEVKSKINDIDDFFVNLKEYIYLNGLVDGNKATYIKHKENANMIDIELELNNNKKTRIYATINLDNNKYDFSDNY